MEMGHWIRLTVVGAAVAVAASPTLSFILENAYPSVTFENAGPPTVSVQSPPKLRAPRATLTRPLGPRKPAHPVKPKPKPKPRCVEATSDVEPPPENWEGRWESQPAQNDPVTVRICVDDVTPAVGQEVTVTLVADDPDAVLVDDECGWTITWGDEESPPLDLCRDYLIWSDSPRPVPAEESGHIERSASHVYTEAGSFTIRGSAWSGEYQGYEQPYSSRATAELTIRVR